MTVQQGRVTGTYGDRLDTVQSLTRRRRDSVVVQGVQETNLHYWGKTHRSTPPPPHTIKYRDGDRELVK